MTHSLKCGANALWRKPNFPHKDWQQIRLEDRDFEREICQNCDKQSIRFVHVLQHDDWQGEIRVGCICVELLTGISKKVLKAEERKARSETEKRKWLRDREAEDRAEMRDEAIRNFARHEDAYLHVDGDDMVRVFKRAGYWYYTINHLAGEGSYSNADYAMDAAYRAYLKERFRRAVVGRRIARLKAGLGV